MPNLVKYGSYDLEEAQKEKEALEAGGADFMKLKVGRNVVRILPPAVGQRTPFKVVYQHFIDLPGKKLVFVCPRFEAKRACPVCQKADQLKGSSAKADQDAASDFFARRRVYCNAIDRGEPDKGPQVLAFGKTVHEQLVALRADEDAGGDFCNPEEGFDIIIERSGTGKNDTKYVVRPARSTSALHPNAAVMQEWIDTQKNLNLLAKPPSPEELETMLRGGEDAPEEEERPKGRPVGRKRSAEDDAIDTDGADAG